MLLIATVAAMIAADAPAPELYAAPERQAQAVVRIIVPARVKLGEAFEAGEQSGVLRETSLPGPDGELQPALLVEFS